MSNHGFIDNTPDKTRQDKRREGVEGVETMRWEEV